MGTLGPLIEDMRTLSEQTRDATQSIERMGQSAARVSEIARRSIAPSTISAAPIRETSNNATKAVITTSERNIVGAITTSTETIQDAILAVSGRGSGGLGNSGMSFRDRIFLVQMARTQSAMARAIRTFIHNFDAYPSGRR